jgi:D-3-phosphoglycerate dehydrogenase
VSRIAYIDCGPLMAVLLDAVADQPPGLTVFRGDPEPHQLARLCADADVVLNGHTRMDAALIGGAARLKSIVFLGAGPSSYIDMAAAAGRGIKVRSVRGYGDRSVAEHAFALMLTAARDVARMDREVRAGTWRPREGIELAGRTLGVIGTGGIGAEMARMAAAFGMRVLAWNRSGIAAGIPAEPTDLDQLLAASDVVSLHLALTAETRHIIDALRLARMKAGAILVNTARGALVDEGALIAALAAGRLAHAALDVFAEEPLPAGHPLTRLENVTLAAHSGWQTRAASERLLRRSLALAAADARAVAAGQPLEA